MLISTESAPQLTYVHHSQSKHCHLLIKSQQFQELDVRKEDNEGQDVAIYLQFAGRFTDQQWQTTVRYVHTAITLALFVLYWLVELQNTGINHWHPI